MAGDTKHDSVWEWLQDCPYIKDLFFNFSQADNGDTILMPMTAYNDETIESYIDGSSLNAYDFSLIRFEAYADTPNDTQNIAILADCEAIARWVDEQEALRNYPTFPSNCSVFEVKALPSNDGYLSAQDETGAKYTFQFRIIYLKGR